MAAQVTKYPYLISKYLDPLFGVTVGLLSFYSYEQRVGREDGHTLKDLAFKKYSAMKDEWNKPKS